MSFNRIPSFFRLISQSHQSATAQIVRSFSNGSAFARAVAEAAGKPDASDFFEFLDVVVVFGKDGIQRFLQQPQERARSLGRIRPRYRARLGMTEIRVLFNAIDAQYD